MKIKMLATIIAILLSINISFAQMSMTIVKMEGEVKVRPGLEETWQKAKLGMILKDIDTILTGEEAWVELKNENGSTFRLSSYAVLDISDLRKVREKDLFQFIMSKKIEKLDPVDKKAKIRIGNVSVVHGSQVISDSINVESVDNSDWFRRETNGTLAMYRHDLFRNTILKAYKVISNYDTSQNCGLLYFYMGRSFEALNQKGQAADYYRQSIACSEKVEDGEDLQEEWLKGAKDALERLNP